MNTINQIFELNQVQLPSGCVGVDTKPLIAAAKAAVARRVEIDPMVKFTVKVDGEFHFIKSIRALEKVLQAITPGSKCRVFRNAGFGATLDFDID
jgi:hypothetical protein